MKDLNDKFYMLVRLWITKKIKATEFIEIAEWIGFRQEAVHLACRQLTIREFNRVVGEAFFAATKAKDK